MSVRFYVRASRSTGVSVGPVAALVLGALVLGVLLAVTYYLAIALAVVGLGRLVVVLWRGRRRPAAPLVGGRHQLTVDPGAPLPILIARHTARNRIRRRTTGQEDYTPRH